MVVSKDTICERYCQSLSLKVEEGVPIADIKLAAGEVGYSAGLDSRLADSEEREISLVLDITLPDGLCGIDGDSGCWLGPGRGSHHSTRVGGTDPTSGNELFGDVPTA